MESVQAKIADLFEEINRAKYERLLDLIRRASANGTHEEVAKAIVKDWFPKVNVDKQGKIILLIEND